MALFKKDNVTNYCPICLNDTLALNSRGKVDIYINGKKMDAGHFLFNTGKDTPDELLSNFSDKLEEFFQWYGNFQNKEPIKTVDIVSSDFTCEKKCRIDLTFKGSVIGILIPQGFLAKRLKELSQDYDIRLDV